MNKTIWELEIKTSEIKSRRLRSEIESIILSAKSAALDMTRDDDKNGLEDVFFFSLSMSFDEASAEAKSFLKKHNIV